MPILFSTISQQSVSHNVPLKMSIHLALLCAISISLLFLPSYYAHESPKEHVDAHNKARAAEGVGLPPLTWNETLAEYARNYGKGRAKDCELIHSTGSYGENLAWSSGDMTPQEAVQLWYDEKAWYDYNANTCLPDKDCGHYTQVVWRDTLRVGCAAIKCDTGGTYVGCNYDPPGNYIGEKPY